MKLFLPWAIIIFSSLNVFSQIQALPNAHSHNDYNRAQPLFDALSNGFTSIEADILYIYGELYVGHNMPDSANHQLPTLEEAYLKPLYNHFQKNNGEIYPDYQAPFYLWIDIKFESWKSYKKLRTMLEPYKDMLVHWNKDQKKEGKVLVILSGDRPFYSLLRDDLKLATLDGRLGDLDKDIPAEWMPFISQNMKDIFQPESDGSISKEEYQKLLNFIQTVNQRGMKTRLWATYENEKLWDQLLKAGIDLLNTDDLKRLKEFLLK